MDLFLFLAVTLVGLFLFLAVTLMGLFLFLAVTLIPAVLCALCVFAVKPFSCFGGP